MALREPSARGRRRPLGGLWMAIAVCVIGAGLVLACAGPPERLALPETLRNPAAGPVVGTQGTHGGHAWLGIPFAAPPVGERRWRAPEPHPPWSGPRDARSFGHSCPQIASAVGGDLSAPPGTIVGNEDCLTLNVYAPAFAAGGIPTNGDRLPVMVWIHGGGNTIGTTRFYDGSRLATDQGVVVVSIQYRLGPLGWFRHPALFDGASPAEQSGNFAVLDMIRALEWVRDNGSAFGGDPGRVTIFGESAGGFNVLALLTSPPARGLFQRAISQSGGTWTSTLAEATNFADDAEPGHPRSALELTLDVLVRSGRADDLAAARAQLAALPAHEVETLLRSQSAAELLEAWDDESGGSAGIPQGISDGVVLPASGIEAALADPGQVSPVPVLLGTNRDENKLFQFFDPKHVRMWFDALPQVFDEEHYLRSADYRSRHWKITGADTPARLLSQHRPGEVYVYRFDWDEEPKILWADLGKLLGASHGFEIPFVFGHFELGPQTPLLFDARNLEGREALSRRMRSYWAEFARSGDPGRGSTGSLPRWVSWDPESNDGTLLFDTLADGGVRMERGSETQAELAATLRDDPRFEDATARCDLFEALADDSGTGADGLALRAVFESTCTEGSVMAVGEAR